VKTWEHYSSVRNIDGPFTGLPEVNVKEPSSEDMKAGAAIARTINIEDWMLKAVTTSLPSLSDETAIRKALEEAKGDVNTAVSKLMDAEYLSSQPSSPGGPHSPGSSSVERDADSDDDDVYGPNKRQYRRMKEASKTKAEEKDEDSDMQVIPSIEVTSPTDEDRNAPSSTTNSRASTASRETTPFTASARTQQRQLGPKRVTARERKDLKKAAQKKARKERGKGGANEQAVKRSSPVTESSMGMKTLYI
jgi:OTU domain-containing protein 3